MSQVEREKTMNVSELLNCTSSGIDHQCLHSQDAGVICNGTVNDSQHVKKKTIIKYWYSRILLS